MVEVICDTNFLIHLATRRIKNIDNIDVEIGQITFVVPQVVKNELSELAKNPEKNQDIQSTLNYIKNFKIIPILGTFADKELLDYVSNNKVIVATMDKKLKKQIKNLGSSIMSFSNDKIVLES
ncbi:twitching motility protein PilT [Marine Group I thaumarchaeote]|uniref:Twitching motility protein PilT n=1 Tax=Marine Group I thaumarchaeote TaxID=2511932 RepID=A0A7K4P1P0_9ARCH|nr:MAG: twitching motility protein PilT [Nitrosopumilus sp. YT1]NMI82443.1 twitching motility protein PilT [Candidatus Nitrosopumilus sp. MTA1]NWJ28668.1 twitching motility protein PilT [Marine Group I thaumarchaeote]NWJ29333.1 twitching motility protein PilT [Marine Group I thaumarchaeote]NWJ56566.1 twitching motility protein PilT [Marine Group I thaumarchaeote]